MIIKIILIAVILVITALTLRTAGSDSNLALRRLGMSAFAVIAVASVIWPSLTTFAARLVGVNRGTDLLLYLFILAFLGSLLSNYLRTSTFDRQITQLARINALQNVRHPMD